MNNEHNYMHKVERRGQCFGKKLALNVFLNIKLALQNVFLNPLKMYLMTSYKCSDIHCSLIYIPGNKQRKVEKQLEMFSFQNPADIYNIHSLCCSRRVQELTRTDFRGVNKLT